MPLKWNTLADKIERDNKGANEYEDRKSTGKYTEKSGI